MRCDDPPALFMIEYTRLILDPFCFAHGCPVDPNRFQGVRHEYAQRRDVGTEKLSTFRRLSSPIFQLSPQCWAASGAKTYTCTSALHCPAS